jgi:hypothetical protein
MISVQTRQNTYDVDERATSGSISAVRVVGNVLMDHGVDVDRTSVIYKVESAYRRLMVKVQLTKAGIDGLEGDDTSIVRLPSTSQKVEVVSHGRWRWVSIAGHGYTRREREGFGP